MTIQLSRSAITFQRVLTQTDARDAVWYVWKRTKLQGAVLAWIVGSFFGTYIGSKVAGVPFYVLFLPLFVLAAPAAIVGLHWFLIRRLSQLMLKRAREAGPETWTVDESGISVENAQGTAHLKWSALRSLARTGRLIIVQLQGRSIPIPRSNLTTEQQDALQQLYDEAYGSELHEVEKAT